MAPPRGPGGPPLGIRPRPGGGSKLDGISPGTVQRLARGWLWGLVASVVMGAVTLIAIRLGVSPMPTTVAQALVGELAGGLAGGLVSGPVLVVAAAGLHLLYGGFWGSVLAIARVPVRPVHGLILAAGLWGIGQTLVLPLAGWGMFGQELGYLVPATLSVSHLVYGLVLGILLSQGEDPVSVGLRHVAG